MSPLLCCLLSDSFDVLDGSGAVTEPEAPGFALDTCPWRGWKNNCCGFLVVSIHARQLPRYKAAYKHLWGPQSRQVVPLCQRWADSRAKQAGQRGARGNWGFSFLKICWGFGRTSPGANHRQHNLFPLPHPKGISNLVCSYSSLPAMLHVCYIQTHQGLRSLDFLSEFQLRVAIQGLDSPLDQEHFYFPVPEEWFFSAIYFCDWKETKTLLPLRFLL